MLDKLDALINNRATFFVPLFSGPIENRPAMYDDLHDTTLRFTVWQFVRLMVHLEDRQNAKPGPHPDETALLNAWADIWSPLDQDLARLAESDTDAYSDMMMDQDVVIEEATPAQVLTTKAALEAVIKEMDKAIKRGGEAALLDSLTFERRELGQLIRKLGRQLHD